MAGGEPRELRADARVNRRRILEVAAVAFAAEGAGASLKAIAADSGVGIGTLYRHFPTREDLIVAIHSGELDRLCESAPASLKQAGSAASALRRWIGDFVDYLTRKHGLAEALRATQSGALGGTDPASAFRMRDRETLGTGAPSARGVTGAEPRGATAPDGIQTTSRDTPDEVPFPGSRSQVLTAITALMQAGVADGTLRGDVDPWDVLVAVNGIAMAAFDEGQAARLLDLLVDSLAT